MKKRILSFVVVLAMIFFTMIPAGAETNIEEGTTANTTTNIYYEDGSYLTVGPVNVENISLGRSSIQQLKASKPITYTNSSGTVEWEYVLHAEFTVVYGSDSYCLNTYYKQNIYEGNWTFSDGNAYFSDNVATGVGVYVKKFLGITTQTCNINTSLTCDVYGNIT